MQQIQQLRQQQQQQQAQLQVQQQAAQQPPQPKGPAPAGNLSPALQAGERFVCDGVCSVKGVVCGSCTGESIM
jgi:hypothetical protein